VRTRTMLIGLKEAGFTVYDCSYPKKNILRYFIGFFRFLKYKKHCDVICIGFMGHFLMPIARIFTRKRIIFDAFVSVYQTLAFDRKKIPEKGGIANSVKWAECLAYRYADAVLMDTREQIKYLHEVYPRLPMNNFQRSILGADNHLLQPAKTEEKHPFTVHFHGEFQALHGIRYILDAAKILPDIPFSIIGDGMEYAERKKQAEELNLKNVTFTGRVPFDKVKDYIEKASVCIGIIGETQKTQLVSPLKIYEYLAMKKTVITADTPALREVFTPGKDLYGIPAANPQALADAIRELQNHPGEVRALAENGHQTFNAKCTPKIIGEEIYAVAEKLTGQN